MSTAPLVPQRMSVEEYLRTSFDGPDLEYLDGELVERNMGNLSHGRIQFLIARILAERELEAGLFVVVETRAQVTLTRYRIPDVAVYMGKPEEQVPTTPPLIAVEILSPDDRIGYLVPKLMEYQAWGVPHIWIVDPEDRKLFVYGERGLTEVPRLELAAHGLNVTSSALFG